MTYHVGVNMTLAGNISQVLHGYISQFQRMVAEIKAAEGALTRWEAVALRTANVVKFAFGAGAVLGGFDALAKAGNGLVKIQQDMKVAGVELVDIQHAYAKSWELTGKYQNVAAEEILDTLKQARQIMANEKHPYSHVIDEFEPFVKAMSFLRSYDGGKHGHNLDSEMNAAMRYAEFSGKMTPESINDFVDKLVGMKVAFGGGSHGFSIAQAYQNANAAGVALRNTSDEFKFGKFPAMAQIMPGAGVALMTLWQKLGAGTRMTADSFKAMQEIGLLNDGAKLKIGRGGKPEGFDPSTMIKGHSTYMKDPDKWAAEVLGPLLEKKFGKVEYDQLPRNERGEQTTDWSATQSNPALEKQTAFIGRLMGDRNAMKVIVELLQMHAKVVKDAENVKKAIDIYKSGGGLDYTQNSMNYWTQALSTAWKNLMGAIGQGQVEPAVAALRALTGALNSIGHAAKSVSPDTWGMIGKGLLGLSAALAAFAGVNLLLALAAALTPVGVALTALATAAAMFAPQIQQIGTRINEALGGIPGMVASGISAMASGIASKISAALASIGSMIGGFLGFGGGSKGGGEGAAGGVQKQSFAPPASGGGSASVIHTHLNVDGRRLAQAVSFHQARGAQHVTTAAGYDGVRHPTPVDYSMA